VQKKEVTQKVIAGKQSKNTSSRGKAKETNQEIESRKNKNVKEASLDNRKPGDPWNVKKKPTRENPRRRVKIEGLGRQFGGSKQWGYIEGKGREDEKENLSSKVVWGDKNQTGGTSSIHSVGGKPEKAKGRGASKKKRVNRKNRSAQEAVHGK